MDFIIDDQTPIALVKYSEMGKSSDFSAVRQHLIRRQGHRANIFDRAGIFGDVPPRWR